MPKANQQDQHKLQDIEINKALGKIKNKILVMSGKGGVGKSSVAAFLAVALAKRGRRVGLMDVDLHGPSIPRILGLKGTIEPGSQGNKARPVAHIPNMQVISIETLMGEQNRDMATIWRGPLKIGVIRQFIADIEWDELDYLVIDSPPGTGDEPLTVAQTIPDAKAVIVTTPQEVSLADVRKSINFCRQVNMEILGIVENMSGLICPYCGKKVDLFKTNGGMLTAKKENLRLLASLPLEPEVVQGSDSGNLSLLDNEDFLFTREFNKMVDTILSMPETQKTAKILHADPQAGKNPQSTQRIIVVPVSDGKLSSHFGHCEHFAFIETHDGKIRSTEMKTPPPHEPGSLPRWLHEQGADIIIAGGMGEQAQQLFRQSGIDVVIGAPMDPPESLVNQYLSGTLTTGNNLCDH